jgi:excisionase family DNA binding protein
MTRKLIERAGLELAPEGAKLMTINEAAVFVRVSRRTIYNWIEDGKVDFVRIPSGSVRVIQSSLVVSTQENSHDSQPVAHVS